MKDSTEKNCYLYLRLFDHMPQYFTNTRGSFKWFWGENARFLTVD